MIKGNNLKVKAPSPGPIQQNIDFFAARDEMMVLSHFRREENSAQKRFVLYLH